jgi:probable phosphoglycerate mutase
MSYGWKAYVDGAARSNPGGGGIGVVLHRPEGDPIEISEWIATGDSNYAEYAALLVALAISARHQVSSLHVLSDSQVVVRQISGRYRCQSPALRPIHDRCQELIRGFEVFSIAHISREQNFADRLAHTALEDADPAAGPRRCCPESLLEWVLEGLCTPAPSAPELPSAALS